jgi:RNA polymerase sigma factor (TIGR02999 family)
VSRLLERWRDGDKSALAELMPPVYDDLCRLARILLRPEEEPALPPSALVHEVYLRLLGIHAPGWSTRAHFYGFVARLMRQILVDHARSRKRSKRGQGAHHLPLDQALELAAPGCDAVTALSHALYDLHRIDPQRSRIVRLRYFVGLTTEETASACGVSTATIKREWQSARIWLRRALAG